VNTYIQNWPDVKGGRYEKSQEFLYLYYLYLKDKQMLKTNKTIITCIEQICPWLPTWMDNKGGAVFYGNIVN